MSEKEEFDTLASKLEERKSLNRLRSLVPSQKSVDSSRIVRDGKTFINFSSNDYLGLSSHPKLIQRSVEYTQIFGTGSSSSRLITGSMNYHHQTEEKIAALHGRERALLYNSGFQANATILPAITKKGDWIIADKQCHNSMLRGCLSSPAVFYRFKHNDLNHLERFLKRFDKVNSGKCWIVTESLFSMDGDLTPLEELIDLANKYGAKLYVDDAHAFGVYGRSGLGLTADLFDIDIVIGTFGKAAGSFGAFVLCNNIIANSLINFSTGFIYTTALPPSVVGSIDAAFDLIPMMDAERKHLHSLSGLLRTQLKEVGAEIGVGNSHIIPILLGSESDSLAMSQKLEKKGIIATAIRPPTVPENQSRIRISLTANHTEEQILKLLSHFKDA
ncbi:MAG: 8-amino-7-oxononanoate synthase [Balneolaceae bacterium]